MKTEKTFSACILAIANLFNEQVYFPTPKNNQSVFNFLVRMLGKPRTTVNGKIPDSYSGPVLARIDSYSWAAVRGWGAPGEDLLEIYDPRAGGWVKVRKSQFFGRWTGRGIFFPEAGPEVNNHIDKEAAIQNKVSGFYPKTAGNQIVPTGITCLCLAFRYLGIDMHEKRLMHENALNNTEPALSALADIARTNGLKAKSARLDWNKAIGLGAAYPAIASCRDGSRCILCNIDKSPDGKTILQILRPGTGKNPFERLGREAFEKLCSGDVILLKRKRADIENRPFGLGWFMPEFLRQKSIFIKAFIAMLVIMAISLAIPVFFQLVIDKVLPHHTFNSLNVLAAGVLIAIIYNAVLEFLKSYLLYFATNKIDMNLSIKTFRHLMRLPVGFFENIPSGLVLKHIQQTEKIRGFMSGNLFFALMDVFSLFVFIPVLMLYSVWLAFVVLAFSLLMMLIVLALVKPFQKKLDHLYRMEGKRQSRLVESICGIRTIKSLAIEPKGEKDWNEISANAIHAHFEVGKISFTARALSQFLEMALGVAVVWYGAHLVFDMAITIGALVAFQMIAGRVSAPLVRLVALIHEYQQVALSVNMLGIVMNAKPESAGGKLHSEIKGEIEFHEVTFRYKPDMQPAINDMTLRVRRGEILGLVGRSGSGKSTFARLLQALYLPQQGFIRIDGVDIRELEKLHLRRNIGVVLQDNYFFHGTIRDNIRIAAPDATPQAIIDAAKAAGAHSFISQMRAGYDTMLEENAVNLSGGQRQRLAIARVLITNPPILILDEATSSLDPESEWEIQKNLGRIARNKTVIIISHRLSLMRHASRIVVLEKGKITDIDAHDNLVRRPGLYRTFWCQQMSGENGRP